MQLTPLQSEAVCQVRNWFLNAPASQVFTLAGYAGSGKSTIIPDLLSACGLVETDVAFVTPTGKSALVVTGKLKDAGLNTFASTIHKRIYRPKSEMVDKLEQETEGLRHTIGQLLKADVPDEEKLARLKKTLAQREAELDRAYSNADGPKFVLNRDADIGLLKLIIVDEASMVGSMIADDLRTFGVKILAIGDPGQLPPVKDDYGFALQKPDFFLHEIHRQALDSPIIRLSMLAREGKPIKPGNYGDGVDVVRKKNDNATFDLNRSAQVLVGRNMTRWQITKKLRKALGFDSTGPMEGEPLIVRKNSRVYPDLMNGIMLCAMSSAGDLREGNASFLLDVETSEGRKHRIECFQGQFEEGLKLQAGYCSAPSWKTYRTRIDAEQIDWGHALTVHSAQGSSFEDVIIHDESGVFRSDAKKWLYTSLTRAEKRLTLVVD